MRTDASPTSLESQSFQFATYPPGQQLSRRDSYFSTDEEVQERVRQMRHDLHEARAIEFESVCLLKEAIRIRKCGGGQGWICKHRLCPSCAKIKHRCYLNSLNAIVGRFSKPFLIVFRVYSNGLGLRALQGALAKLRRGLRGFRRSSLLAGRACVGLLEYAINQDAGRPVWNVHVHLIVDMGEGIDLDDLRQRWRRWTGARRADANGQVPKDLAAIMTYMAKRRDRCPAPGTMPPALLKVLVRGIHDEQVFIAWGKGTRRGRTQGSADARKRRRVPLHQFEVGEVEELFISERSDRVQRWIIRRRPRRWTRRWIIRLPRR